LLWIRGKRDSTTLPSQAPQEPRYSRTTRRGRDIPQQMIPATLSDAVPPPGQPGFEKTTADRPSEQWEPGEAESASTSTGPNPSVPPPPHGPRPAFPSLPPTSPAPPATSAPLRLAQAPPQRPSPFAAVPLPAGGRPTPAAPLTSALARRRRRQHRGRCPSAPRAPLPTNSRPRSRRPSPRAPTAIPTRSATPLAARPHVTQRGGASSPGARAVGEVGGRCPRDSRPLRPRCRRAGGSALRPGRPAPPCRGTAPRPAARTEGDRAPGTSASSASTRECPGSGVGSGRGLGDGER